MQFQRDLEHFKLAVPAKPSERFDCECPEKKKTEYNLLDAMPVKTTVIIIFIIRYAPLSNLDRILQRGFPLL